MTRRRLAALWIALQVLFLAGWAVREHGRLDEGVSILVRPEPVDPRDLLRGQFLALRYGFTWPWDELGVEPFEDGATAWVVLADEGGFHVPVDVRHERPDALPPGAAVLRGRVENRRCVFGVESYFVPEGSPTPAPEDTVVRLRVGADGGARIEEVYVDGRPWP